MRAMLTAAIVYSAFAVANGVELQGRWVSQCPEAGFASTTTLDFRRSDSNWTLTSYASTDCSTVQYRKVYDLSYQLRGLHPQNPNISSMDLSFLAVRLVPLSNDIVADYISRQMCGFSDWAVGVAKEVTGRVCAGQFMPSRGQAIYGSYQRRENTLMLGAFTEIEDGTTPARRPAQLDTSIGYVLESADASNGR